MNSHWISGLMLVGVSIFTYAGVGPAEVPVRVSNVVIGDNLKPCNATDKLEKTCPLNPECIAEKYEITVAAKGFDLTKRFVPDKSKCYNPDKDNMNCRDKFTFKDDGECTPASGD